MPELFADGHEEWEVSAIVSHRWWASHLQYLVSWVGFAEHENSRVSESDLANSPALVTEYWASRGGIALRPRACGNAGARPEDMSLLKEGGKELFRCADRP
jgi:hypothetical protein